MFHCHEGPAHHFSLLDSLLLTLEEHDIFGEAMEKFAELFGKLSNMQHVNNKATIKVTTI